MSRSTRRLTVVVAGLAILVMAPTVGDTGGCGRTAVELDRDRYASARKLQDCEKCQECAVQSERCRRACDATVLPEIVLPATCRPLYHDGVVCLRALAAAACDRFAAFVDDEAPETPSECGFCRLAPPEATPSLDDGGVGK